MAIDKLNLRVLPHQRATAESFNRVSRKVDELVDAFNSGGLSLSVTASPAVNADFSLAEGEAMVVEVHAEGVAADGAKIDYYVERHTSDPTADAEWNISRGNAMSQGWMELTMTDLHMSDGVPDAAAQFVITAIRAPDAEGGLSQGASTTVTVLNIGGSELTNDNADPMIAQGEPKPYRFAVRSARGADITHRITRWAIERQSSDPVADRVWAMRDKARQFDGQIEILWSADPQANDLDPNEAVSATRFVVTAYIDENPVACEYIDV